MIGGCGCCLIFVFSVINNACRLKNPQLEDPLLEFEGRFSETMTMTTMTIDNFVLYFVALRLVASGQNHVLLVPPKYWLAHLITVHYCKPLINI